MFASERFIELQRRVRNLNMYNQDIREYYGDKLCFLPYDRSLVGESTLRNRKRSFLSWGREESH